MKNWKRVAAFGLAAVMAAGMVTACGGSSEEAATEAAADDGAEAADTEAAGDGEAAADDGEKKEIYVFIRDRGDLSYWDSMAEGGDRAVEDYADRANVHVIETTADVQANLQAMYEGADAGADLIITASDFKDNVVTVANEYPDIAFTISLRKFCLTVPTTTCTELISLPARQLTWAESLLLTLPLRRTM